MGYSKEEIDGKIDDILSFADIGDFVYQPVKVYSSGMFVRLAFAVAINVDPDILIVDEALSVGDMRFQQKCYRKIEEFKETKTVLFVSHDLSVINKYCDRAIWLDAGRVLDDNLPEVVAKKYQAFMMGSFLNKTNNSSNNEVSNLKEKRINVRPLSENLDVFGDSKAVITGVDLKDLQKDESISIVTQGQEVKLLINVRANELIGNPIIGFSIKDRLGSTITESNSSVLAGEIEPLFPEKDYTFAFYFTFPPLLRGEYTISTAVASGTMEDHVQHCWVHDALIVQMFDSQKYQLSGILSLKDAVFYQLE
jgi:energy-coupling factor transporter ATP-binding protein EcfA2